MFNTGTIALNSDPLSSWGSLLVPDLVESSGNVTFFIDGDVSVSFFVADFELSGNSTFGYKIPLEADEYIIGGSDLEFEIHTKTTLAQDIQSLSPGAIIEMFELDTTSIGGSLYRFHAGTNELHNPVVWQGNTYSPMPIEARGFEINGQGQLPRPTVKVANITGVLGALVRSLDDLVGSKVTRKRTMVKYLDAVNFTGGTNPTADPNQYYPDEVFFINRKSSENKVFIEFELSSALDVQGVKLPRRQVVQNLCTWIYRSSECSYAGGAVADIYDNPTSNLALDACSKKLGACKMRFGTYAQIPFGGYPGAGRLT